MMTADIDAPSYLHDLCDLLPLLLVGVGAGGVVGAGVQHEDGTFWSFLLEIETNVSSLTALLFITLMFVLEDIKFMLKIWLLQRPRACQ